jgi:hypothetical protein
MRNDGRFYGDGRRWVPKGFADAGWRTHLAVLIIGSIAVLIYGIFYTGNGKPTLQDRIDGTTVVSYR